MKKNISFSLPINDFSKIVIFQENNKTIVQYNDKIEEIFNNSIIEIKKNKNRTYIDVVEV